MKKSIDVVEGAVNDGIITEERINESALKVLKMKERLGLDKTNVITMDETHNTIGRKSNFTTADEIAKSSITLVKNDNMLLPLQPDPSEEFYVVDLYDGPNNHNESNVTMKLREHGYKVNSFQIDKSDSLIIANYILDQIPKDALVLLNAYANPVEWKDNIFLPNIEAEFIEEGVNKYYRKALEEEKLVPVNKAEVKDVHFHFEEHFTFKAAFEIEPEVVLPKMKKNCLKVQKTEYISDDIDIDLSLIHI